jgi:hypothetical protein
MSTSVDVDVSGPLFDGRARAYCAQMCDEIQDDIAAQAYSDVMGTLNRRIKHPTPYYETQVAVSKVAGGRLVHDRGIVYGPWLEGTGSRNRTTRFKGYHAWALARLALPAKARGLAERVVRKWAGRL